MSRARAVLHAFLLSHVVKQCRSDDNSLGENIVIKPPLKPWFYKVSLSLLIFIL